MKNLLKRSISMFLAVIMMLGLFAACGNGEEEVKTEEKPSEETTTNTEETKPEEEAKPEVDPLAITPYSDGPRPIEAIVEEMLSELDLPELSEEDKNYTVNLGYYNCDHMAAASVGEYTGIFEKLGMKVKVTGNGNVPEAMSAGQMDMAYCGWTTTLSAVQNNVPLFIAAENHTGGSEYLVVSNDIKNPEDLVG